MQMRPTQSASYAQVARGLRLNLVRLARAQQQVASGLAAVWARDNTREALFEAMERREVYATTGSRIVVRLFGGWKFTRKDATRHLPANVGYQKGVPMGGDLSAAPEGKAPSFLIRAVKDPVGGNLFGIGMAAHQPLLYPVACKQLQCMPGILAGDDINFPEDPEGPEGYVFEVADRGGYYIKCAAHLG